MNITQNSNTVTYTVKAPYTVSSNDVIFSASYRKQNVSFAENAPFFSVVDNLIRSLSEDLYELLYGTLLNGTGEYKSLPAYQYNGRFGAMVASVYGSTCKALGANAINGYPPFASFCSSIVKPNPNPLTIEMLKTKRVAVAYSGGAGSRALCSMLKKLDVPHTKVKAYDAASMSERDLKEYPVVLNKLLSGLTSAGGFPFNEGTNQKHGSPLLDLSAPIIRILLAAHCYGKYDILLFGDSLESNALFSVNNEIVPFDGFWSSQWFYNWFNENIALKYDAPLLYQPLGSYSRIQNAGYCFMNKIKINGCVNHRTKWCGECDNCRRAVEIAHYTYKVDEARSLGLPVDEVNQYTVIENVRTTKAYTLFDGPNRCLDGSKPTPLPKHLSKSLTWNSPLGSVVDGARMVKELRCVDDYLQTKLTELYGIEEDG